MNDFAGFVITLLILIFLIYVAIQFVIPFLMIWVLPSVVFYTALFFIIRKNKVVSGELDFYVTDRGLKLIGIYSLLPLFVHSAVLFLFELSEHAKLIAVMNSMLILFVVSLFFAHYFENQKRFYLENHYIDVMVEKYIGLQNALLFLKNDIQILLSENLILNSEADSYLEEIEALSTRIKSEKEKIEALLSKTGEKKSGILNGLSAAKKRFIAMLEDFREYEKKFNLIRSNFQEVR